MGSEADELAARLERIKRLTDEYLIAKAQSDEAKQLSIRINEEVDAAVKQIARPSSRQ
jgi:hypothetical protein